MNKLLLNAALAGILTVGVAVSAHAADAPKTKCYGIAKKGANDCKTDAHSCAGQSTSDMSKADWKYTADDASCKKAGGTTESKKM